ncbi:MAG TPA: LysM peptidoglycan-binding domain-containing M23 family metallopeptidase [Candidatus Ornithospirochaeta avicola]|uniref:LysM peptidoglycan-binding domain-containing M23 family metallopeptidase n=1 Tax=Candidatus Ornithospirochaeta avicola TaxID=2840896 RepID=A0A9D1PRD1_9SPIO|nr:LysM peptidoglycan-binding domain-containing M23 family metallopeptidase [Candidatus Ornithospirochaeta avicola]
MPRDDYDDMNYSRARDEKKGRKTLFVSVFLTLLVLIAVILVILFGPSENLESKKEEQSVISQGALESSEEKQESGFFREYTVRDGDSVISISDEFSLSAETIASLNAIKSNSDLNAGQIILIPELDGVRYTLSADESAEEVYSRFSSSVSLDRFIEINQIDDALEKGDDVFVPLSIDSSFTFSRPIESGQIKYSYRESVNGKTISSLGITAEAGSAVLASQDGVVTQAAFDSSSGRYVEIAHSSGYVTRYENLEIINVRKDDVVSKGDIIGTIGTSSSVDGSPVLFFSIKQGALTLDPELYI